MEKNYQAWMKIKIGIMSYHSLISYRHYVKRLSLNLSSKEVLVTLAGENRPHSWTKPNILLACLEVTDLIGGLMSQPAFTVATTHKLFK